MLSGLARPVRHLPAPSPEETMEWMAKFIQRGQFDYRMRALAEKLVADLWPHDYLSEYAAVLNWVRASIRYSRDPRSIEQVKTPAAIVETKTGDCVTHDTEVIVRDARGFYRLVRAGDLAYCYGQYDALSYNFNTGEYEFKPILSWADKGKQEIYRLRMTTGYSARVTSGHRLLFWHSRANEYQERKLCDACSSIEKDGRRRLRQGLTLLAARKIPTLDVDLGAPAEQLWLGGAYMAEGWSEGSHVCVARSGEDRIEVIRRLEVIGVPHRVFDSRPGTGGYISLHAGPVREWLRRFGARATEKAIPWDMLSGSAEALSEIFNGYVWGDSWVNDGECQSHRSHVLMHSTVSDELAKQLKLIHMILGRPLSANYVENHGGLGKNPIWRLWESTGKRYQDRLPCTTNVGVHGVFYDGVDDTCDFEVADNHNFVLSNGLLAHNCDDMSVLVGTLVGLLGGKIRLVAANFKSGGPLAHVWLEAWEPSSKAWVVLDPVPGRKVGQMIGRVREALVKEVLQ